MLAECFLFVLDLRPSQQHAHRSFLRRAGMATGGLLEHRVVQLDAVRARKAGEREVVLGRKAPALAHLHDSGEGNPKLAGDGLSSEGRDGGINAHGADYGQSVHATQEHFSSDILWPVWPMSRGYNAKMSKVSKSAHKASFVQRTQIAREHRGMSQDEMAAALGTTKSPYAKYESRSYMPQHLIATFVAITGESFEWLHTGIGKAPPVHEDAIKNGYVAASDSQKTKVG